MLLADYTNAVRDILHDPNANFYSVAQINRWINRARRRTAEKGRCVRRMPPSKGTISSITLNAGGAGYVSPPTVAISAPDYPGRGNVQATATATILAGAVTGFTITNAGAGYVAPATATLTGGSGTGAAGTPVITNHITTVPDQEVYQLATIAANFGALTPGLGDFLGIQSVSVSWGAMKPTLAMRDFSWLQMYARSFGMNYVSNPRVWAPYEQGVAGSFYLWPVPQQYMAMELDCYFDVADISTIQTVDLIPSPWNEPVFYYAAYLAYLNAQRVDDARTMLGEHERLMAEARGIVTPDRIPDPYGEP